MEAPAIPPDEDQRLADVEAAGVAEADEGLDAITRVVAAILDVPVALVSIVDKESQVFSGCFGLDIRSTARDVSFCGHAILGDDVFVVNDARADPRFQDNPLVTGEPNVVFYAGMPIRGRMGHRIGTLCVMDHSPREASEEDLRTLRRLANWVELEIGRRWNSTEDAVRATNRARFWDMTRDLFCVLDLQGRVLDANQPMADLAGGDLGNVIGTTVDTLTHPQDWPAAKHQLGRLAQGKEMGAVRGRLRDPPDGRAEVWIEWTAVPVGENAFCVGRDVTEAVQRETWRLDFVSTVAHDLANPLSPIRTNLFVMKAGKDPLTEKQRHQLEMMERNVKRMERLIGDLSLANKLDAGRLEVLPQPMRIDEQAGRIVADYAGEADERGVRLELETEACQAKVDEVRFDQVLSNLVNNALKFTPEGGTITIGVHALEDAVRVEVRDTGVGIEPEDQDRLFGAFEQVDNELQTPHLGTGLGLFICKSLVEAHGGRIGVDSQGAGKGSTFWFEVPSDRGE